MSSGSAKFLVVEDDPIVALDVSKTLQSMGHTVENISSSGEAALEFLKSKNCDLAILDVGLSGKLDGIETGALIVKSRPLPIIFLTGHDDEATLVRATREVRPEAYLVKPFDRDELKRTVEVVLARLASAESEEEEEELDLLAPSSEAAANLGDDERLLVLKKIPFFQELPIEAQIELANAASIRPFEASTVVSELEHESPFIPLSGRLALIESSDDGKEFSLALIGPGDIFGLLTIDKELFHQRIVRAQTDGRLISFSESVFQRVLKRHPESLSLLFRESTSRLSQIFSLSVYLAHAKADERLIRVILNLLPRFGKESPDNSIRLFLTRKELGDLAGTTPETAIRVTKQLEREGFLDLTRPGIIKVPLPEELARLLQSK